MSDEKHATQPRASQSSLPQNASTGEYGLPECHCNVHEQPSGLRLDFHVKAGIIMFGPLASALKPPVNLADPARHRRLSRVHEPEGLCCKVG